MNTLSVYKLIVSILTVVALAEVSKRAGALLGGILAGLPLGAGIAVYFISYEQSVPFMVEGIPWGIAGLSSSLIFCAIYLVVSSRLQASSVPLSIILSSTAAISSFMLWGYLLSLLHLNLITAFLIFIVFFFANITVVKRLVKDCGETKKTKSTYQKLLIRAVFVGFLIIIITSLSSVLGSRWSGILSAFPSTLYPLILILHFEDGNDLYPSLLKGFAYSVSTLVVFYLACYALLPTAGLNVGFLLTYAICFAYLYVFTKYLKLKH